MSSTVPAIQERLNEGTVAAISWCFYLCRSESGHIHTPVATRVTPGRWRWKEDDVQGEGYKPNPFGTPGVEKSSISLFRMTPVTGSRTWLPKMKLTVEVMDTAIPVLSSTEVWLWLEESGTRCDSIQ